MTSGVILEHLDWHWLFLIGGIPVLVAACADSPVRAQVAEERPDEARLRGRGDAVARAGVAPARDQPGQLVGLVLGWRPRPPDGERDPLRHLGIAFSFAAIGKLAVDNAQAHGPGSRPGSTCARSPRPRGPDRGDNHLGEHAGGHAVPAEVGFTAAFAMGAVGVAVALVPTLVLTRAQRPGRRNRVGEAELEAVG